LIVWADIPNCDSSITKTKDGINVAFYTYIKYKSWEPNAFSRGLNILSGNGS
jgi:hypothetical protein